MAHPRTTPGAASLEEAVTVLFCVVDDAYRLLSLQGDKYASLKRLSDSEVLTLALFQQLRGVESERSFLREAARFFAHLFPGVVEAPPLLVPPLPAQAQALPGALAARGPRGTGGRPGDSDRGLDVARGTPPAPG